MLTPRLLGWRVYPLTFHAVSTSRQATRRRDTGWVLGASTLRCGHPQQPGARQPTVARDTAALRRVLERPPVCWALSSPCGRTTSTVSAGDRGPLTAAAVAALFLRLAFKTLASAAPQSRCCSRVAPILQAGTAPMRAQQTCSRPPLFHRLKCIGRCHP
jgi:hypothetical protein